MQVCTQKRVHYGIISVYSHIFSLDVLVWRNLWPRIRERNWRNFSSGNLQRQPGVIMNIALLTKR